MLYEKTLLLSISIVSHYISAHELISVSVTCYCITVIVTGPDP